MTGHRERDGARLRAPADLVAFWDLADQAPAGQLRHRAQGRFWEVIEELGVTVLVSREYEHFVMALTVTGGRPEVSYMRLPHPSGIAVDRERWRVYIAATRNPNQVMALAPGGERMLLPSLSRFYAGGLYMHDLAVVGGRLYANAVGQDSVVELLPGGGWRRAWWPAVLDGDEAAFASNHLQLNSIAAGADLASSFFTASAARPGRRRPGHLDFPVDGTGVVFAGSTRDVFCGGLTRPHSARLHEGEVWVDNSGYGTVGVARRGGFDEVAGLPGWTRGLCFAGRYALAGTSRVLPRFQAYAPGVKGALCGIHAISTASGEVAGSLLFPEGDQVFAIECLPAAVVQRLPFQAGSPAVRAARARKLFYDLPSSGGDQWLI